MRYRKFGNTGLEISALGFGAMRLPILQTANGNEINEEEAIKMIRLAIDNGVNYVDTAYPYHGGKSEILVGKALKDGYRDQTYLATKSPVWAIKKPEDFDRLLDEQLEKLDVEYIDFYLLHALSLDRWNDTVLKYDLLSRMEQAKADGKIRYIGFSFHDEYEAFETILNGYDKWDFCQIQLNYINTDYQAGLKGFRNAAEKGLGVIIMEPLLGGKLAIPPKGVQDVLSKDKTPVEWSLDYLWNMEEVSLLLSGMSDMTQTMDNLSYADRSSIGMLTPNDIKMLEHAKVVFDTMALVPCTKCAYCMPCPFGLDIPKTFEAYNTTASVNMEKASELYTEIETKADACRKCKACEKECPQHIKISELMPTIHEVFQTK
ncbi:aldo/keto reductase [Anaeromicropila herbilytica]|uniref:Aldo/keto reductase n=1 Tax=Anaeromicropila herbilytica TaxID=2785025 RepID=A0A7R7EGM5_9FIRM|nr:aldo/keto reductase [Anaeromicropila herbilytica]BCN28840.1 aldo/keto reductase [Anaeromicropila herbilytica]